MLFANSVNLMCLLFVCVFVVQHWSEDKDSVQGTDAAAPETSPWKQKVKRQLIDFIEFVFE